MKDFLTTENMMFAVNIVGILFLIYISFRNPQIKSEKTDALLAQQLKLNGESIDRRFQEVQKSHTDLVLQSNNHINEVEKKVDSLNTRIGEVDRSVVKLSTIIEERIPRK